MTASALTACNRPAAELPPDYGSVDARQTASLAEFSAEDRALDCKTIDEERVRIQAAADRMTRSIQGNRSSNQTAGYIGGVLFPPALFLMDMDEQQKNQIDTLQKRDDTLIKLKFVKKCKRTDAPAR